MAIRLQCSACNKTLQVADSAAGKKARCPGCQTLNDVPAAAQPKPAVPAKPTTPAMPAEPVKPAASATPAVPPSTVAKPAPASATPAPNKSSSSSPATPANPETLLVVCSSCGKSSRVMKSAAGKTVQCPQCKGKIVVPGDKPNPTAPTAKTTPTAKPVIPTAKPTMPTAKPTMPAAKPSVPVAKPASSGSVDIFGSVPSSSSQGSSSSNSNDIFGSMPSAPSYDAFGGMPQDNGAGWNDLGNQSSGGGGWQSMGPAPTNQYSAPSYGGGGYSTGGAVDRSPAIYMIPGILMSIWSFIVVVGCSVQVGWTLILVMNPPPTAVIRWDIVILRLILPSTLFGILALVQLFGGIALAMRKNLPLARTGAVLCAIPCTGLFCFPIGIWGAILLFSGNPNRDFR